MIIVKYNIIYYIILYTRGYGQIILLSWDWEQLFNNSINSIIY